jgi:protein-disulfide isomerase
LGILVAIISLAAIVFIVVLAGAGNSSANLSITQTNAYAGIEQRGMELGVANAKVVVEEYGDYQCPGCKYWHEQVQPLIIKDYIATGKIKFVFKPLPFLDRNTGARESHTTTEAAYCAADQNRFREYHDALYNNQPERENSGFWSYERLKSLAQGLKLDTAKFNSCLDNKTHAQRAIADNSAGFGRGVEGTPTIFVNGKMLQELDYPSIKRAIDAALGQ